jgi:hypothetical protein
VILSTVFTISVEKKQLPTIDISSHITCDDCISLEYQKKDRENLVIKMEALTMEKETMKREMETMKRFQE